MEYITIAQIIEIHERIISETGGLAGVRALHLVESALAAPRACLFGMDMYPSIPEKAAVYLYHLIKNHAFNDGNKRTAMTVTATFLDMNDFDLPEEEDFENLCVAVAEGSISKDELINLFRRIIQ